MPVVGELSSRERLELARGYVAAGLSVIPIKTDGSKSPEGRLLPLVPDKRTGELKYSWDPFKDRLASSDELLRWFGAGPRGIAVLGGHVSGDLEILDFDDPATFVEWESLVEKDAPGLLDRLPQVCPPGGGRHVFYRCDVIAGNTKLAQVLRDDGEVFTLAETRGEAGYVLTVGCPGACHPSGGIYEPVSAGPALVEVPRITAGERALLWAHLRCLNRYVAPSAVYDGETQQAPSVAGTRPGDEFNRVTDWPEILEPAGWVQVGHQGEKLLWRRPGKTGAGSSANTGACHSQAGNDLFYVWSSNAHPFEAQRGYSKFAAFAVLYHGGDFRAAARAADDKLRGPEMPMCRLRLPPCFQADVAAAEPARPEPVLLTLASVMTRTVEWLWHCWIPRGALSILDGDPGLAKSTLSLELAARVTRGWAMPPQAQVEFGPPADVLLLSDEDDVACTIRPRFEAAGGDLERIHLLDAIKTGAEEHPPVLPFDLELIAERVHQLGVSLIIVDPFLAYLESDTDSHKDQSIRQVTRKLARLARRLNVAMLLIRHLNKLNGGAALYRGGGSIGIVGACRAALVVGRDPQDEDNRILAMNKSNLGPLPPSLIYRLEPTDGDVARIVWGAECDLRPDDILWHGGKPVNGRPPVRMDEAEAFLLKFLADGPKAAVLVYEQGKQAGLSERTLNRAKKGLNIIARRQNYSWLWALPDEHGP